MEGRNTTGDHVTKPKRIRQGARDVPKVKSGCRTCKIRHKKCDETRPSCLQCTRTGRTCDFSVQSSHTGSALDLPRSPFSVARRPKKSSSSPRSISKAFGSNSPIPLLPKPLPALSTCAFASDEVEHFEYFHLICTQEFSRYYELALWKKLILQATFTEPCIRHAVVALGALGRSQMDPLCQSSKDRVVQAADYSSRKYNLAMKELSDRLLESTSASWQLAIIGSLAFITIEVLQGHESGAYMHLRSAFAIMKSLMAGASSSTIPALHAAAASRDTPLTTALTKIDRPLQPLIPSTFHTSTDFDDLLTIFSRYDVQTSFFVGQYSQSPLPLPLLPPTFDTFLAARDSMNALTTSIYFLRHRHSSPSYKTLPYIPLPAPIAAKYQALQSVLLTWSTLFEDYASLHLNEIQADAKMEAAVSYLRIRYLSSHVMLNTHFHRDQTAYDTYLADFHQIVSLAGAILGNPAATDDSQWPFPYSLDVAPYRVRDVWMVQPLYYVVLKSRDGWLRRQALNMMRGIRKHVSGSVGVMVGVGEWVLEMEEGEEGCGTFIEEERRLGEVRLDFEKVGVKCSMSAHRRRTDGSFQEINGEVP